MKFGWDEKKAEENLQDHGVTFDEAEEVFLDRNAIDVFDSELPRPRNRVTTLSASHQAASSLLRTPNWKTKRFGSSLRERQKPSTGKNMKKKMHKSKSTDVTIAVTQKDYDHEIRTGVKPDETFKPGVYRGRRGGFLERHPEALTEKIETKIGIYIKLDRDILQFFKERAKKPNAAPYQTQINNALRAFIERKDGGRDFAELLNNETFIAAVAERVRRKAPSRRSV